MKKPEPICMKHVWMDVGWSADQADLATMKEEPMYKVCKNCKLRYKLIGKELKPRPLGEWDDGAIGHMFD